MTEYWKSNPNFWCEYCKVWLKDTPDAKAVHERGIKHQENVAKRLRDMRHKAVAEKKETAQVASAMASIEAKARKAYEADQAAASAEEQQKVWVRDKESGHFYNDAHGYYYNRSTGMYYGGDPPAWTLEPVMPHDARWVEHSKQMANKPAAAGSSRPAVARKVYKHPLQDLGGKPIPLAGAIGGAKGVGSSAGSSAGGLKRSREEAQGAGQGRPKKAVSEEEAAALAKREAARARVQARELRAFGLA